MRTAIYVDGFNLYYRALKHAPSSGTLSAAGLGLGNLQLLTDLARQ